MLYVPKICIQYRNTFSQNINKYMLWCDELLIKFKIIWSVSKYQITNIYPDNYQHNLN